MGPTAAGEAEVRRCLRLHDDYEAYLRGEGLETADEPAETEASSLEFALEAHLRDFLAKNLDRVEPGLRLSLIDGRNGIEYPVDAGRIDLLATDSKGQYVVIELKLSQGRTKALGQLLYYMGWVDKTLGNGPCRGVVIAAEISEEIKVAASRTPGVSLFRYNMSFSVEKAR